MNPLIHVQMNLQIFDELKLNLDKDLFLFGGILPDIYVAGLLYAGNFHTTAKEFIQYLLENDPEYVALGVGFMLHGEDPKGLDFYAHQKGGFIEKKFVQVKPLVRREQPKIDDVDLTNMSHSLIEFACDYLSSNEAAVALNFAFKRVDLKRVSFHLSTFFGISMKKTYKILKIFKRFNFQKLRTIKGVSSSVQRFLLWKDLNAPTMFQKYKYLKTQFYFMRKRNIKRVFNEVKNLVQPDLYDFLEKAKKEMKKDIPRQLPPGLI